MTDVSTTKYAGYAVYAPITPVSTTKYIGYVVYEPLNKATTTKYIGYVVYTPPVIPTVVLSASSVHNDNLRIDIVTDDIRIKTLTERLS